MFFFKQKTAYEMRISDWSSDVCSSDLDTHCAGGDQILRLLRVRRKVEIGEQNLAFAQQGPLFCLRLLDLDDHFRLLKNDRCRGHDFRSEEHTSELQSLMRISYAVFALKKKKEIKINTTKLKT